MTKYFCFLFSLLIILHFSVSGQKDTIDVTYKIQDTLNQHPGLFDTDELLELSLRFDITTLKRVKSKEEYLPALLTCYLNNTDSINKEVSIRARGKRRLDICSFPPIRINFKKSESLKDEFNHIDKIKVVTHCEPGRQDYTFKEYLIYKLYNVLTDCSYRVRLAKINYINTSGKSKPFSEYAFFIEPTGILAKRQNGTEITIGKLTQRNIKPEVMDRLAIFNFMIGNTDWSLPIFHNVTILALETPEIPALGLAIPYDFDYSGLINANYAVPFEGLGLKSVTERRYLGICRSQEIFRNELKEFSDKKEEFYKVIHDFPYLDEKSKKEMFKYLDGFFNNFEKPNALPNRLMNECER
jgi:hypothetical protein